MITQTSLVSTQNRIEVPFIVIEIGDYTFGAYNTVTSIETRKITFPNFVKSCQVKKVNGTVNTYTIQLVYPITERDDPNMLDRIFSSVSDTRLIKLKYGDAMMPNYIYKEEEVLIKKLQSRVDFKGSKIEYTLEAVSNSINLTVGAESFPSVYAKPSDQIKRLFEDERFGLLDLFHGMRPFKGDLSRFIVGDDKPVMIEGKSNISVLSYINFLVNCMCNVNEDPDAKLKKTRYYWATYDDISNEYGGPYIRVVNTTAHLQYNVDYSTYEVDIGYPSSNLVTDFSINNNESWSLIYEHAEKIQVPEYTYNIGLDGKLVPIKSSAIMNSRAYSYQTEASRTWWSNMTQFPISASLSIKGLLRPAILMSHVRINSYFYGHKHVSSGLYIITKQEDTIDNQGYRTTLALTRVSGDTSLDNTLIDSGS